MFQKKSGGIEKEPPVNKALLSWFIDLWKSDILNIATRWLC